MKISAILTSLVSLLLTVNANLKSQTVDSSMIFYTKGIEAFNKANYKKADSLLSLSIKLFPHADTYFSRAACRQKMGNRKGFCKDLGIGIQLGDKEAAKAYCKQCGSADSSYYSEDGATATKKEHFYLAIKYNSSLTDTICVFYDYLGIFYPGLDLKSLKEAAEKKVNKQNSEVSTIIEENAEFPGGIGKLQEFLGENIKIPLAVRKEGIAVKVYLKFIVSENGEAISPEILRSVPNCPECEKEAIRLVNIMPKWKPAKMSGKPVNCYFNLPIRFKAR
ncbi:MAG: energy transducer TonB [Bacteroidia bacterium]|nr:energy transducer TonB [Bacteroidia bacterium]